VGRPRHVPFPFSAYYVVQGQVEGTWQQRIFDGMLDPDVALIIEANTG